ncbi:hypothetical protein J2Z21_008676 [Streptomyces griseochromogenes]|uniref:Transcriptional regulator n=1 Tax=Streptomyces griseochromogenes TaxID=68214 RepID=A0A1B1B0C1_9ACTN|nr:hypothetical protein [Streptomyces griseochromogenes]ANP52240.1 hypothetical protein AVL59_24200 [Streptomyces griseochromogenes]MBP2055660.1 hypothetical protein [Streptomyces griseochromogenes]
MPHRPVRHPLALLRKQEGLSHTAYARRIAEAHTELGFGTMAARREKIARWESGKVTPELNAQLAIAHIHGVPRSDVLRHGWPEWLYAATGQASLLQLPWSCDEALHALETIARTLPRTDGHGRGIVSCDQSIASLTTAWLDTAAPFEPHGRGLRIDAAGVAALERRHLKTRKLYHELGPLGVRTLVDAELLLLCDLSRNASCDRQTGADLLALTASAACYSGWLAFDLGDQTRAQSAYLAGMRTAAAAENRMLGGWAMTLLAMQHVYCGDPANAHPLLDAAHRACERSGHSPRLTSLLGVVRAVAYAMQGEATAAVGQLHFARTLYSPSPHDNDPPFMNWLTADVMEVFVGAAHFYLGKMDHALGHLLPQLAPAPAATRLEARNTAVWNGYAARAHLASGDADMALEHARQTVTFLAESPSFGVEKQWELLRTEFPDPQADAWQELCALAHHTA